MTVWCLGSINADYFYGVPHLPMPGETLASTSLTTGLGGKGANQSVAAVRAGSTVHHIGAVGSDGAWARDRIKGYGVDVQWVATVEASTGHAIINVADDGENAIVLHQGANIAQDAERIQLALAGAAPGDLLLLQNETNCQAEAAKIARDKGLRVIYSAAPYSTQSVRAVLDWVDVLVMNAVEAAQLTDEMNIDIKDLPVSFVLVTKGADGATWYDLQAATTTEAPIIKVQPVDTTGAGDTFAGYVAAGLDQGLSVQETLRRAAGAGALKVTKAGTADAIPALEDVLAFLESNS